MKVKSSKNNALLFLGSSVLVIAGENVNPTTAHASTVKNNKPDMSPRITKVENSNHHKSKRKKHNFNIVTVKENDTTCDIVQEYGITVNQVIKDNDLQNGGALIHVNDQLKIRTDGKNTATSPAQSQSTSVETATTTYTSATAGDESATKEWIAARESGGSYTARNPSSGTYGRYQLTPDKLNGNYSPANQERVADQYVKSRYGSWTAAKQFWMANNWY